MNKLFSFGALFLAVTLMVMPHAFAVTEGVVSSQSEDFNKSSYDTYTNRINNLKADLAVKAAEIGEIMQCHKNKKLYTSSGCRNVYTPEVDATKAAQADKSITSSSCSGANQARHFNGTSWVCKSIRKVN